MVSKKAQKRRGKRTHGYGSHKKHRGGGSRGGRGMTGAKAHKFVKYLKEKPGHIGKYGFKSKKASDVKSITLREIAKIAEKTGKKEIDIKELGYDKVIGKGDIPSSLVIKADAFSAKAKEKIEKKGGKAVCLSEDNAENKEDKNEE